MNSHNLKLFSCRNSREFSEKVAKSLGIELDAVTVQQFSDGEFQPYYDQSLRGTDVFIIQSTCPPADNLMELLLLIDAAKRASAYRITAVIPYFGWARQDRKDKPRTSIGAKLVADLLTVAGANRIITCDLHADQEQGFFNIPVDHVSAKSVFVPYLRSLENDNLVIATPDIGGSKRAHAYANLLQCPIIVCHKTRTKANVVDDMMLIGDSEGKDVVLVDDMIDTAGTICKASSLLKSKGANSVSACITHPIMSGPAYERVLASDLDKLVVTDTLKVLDKWSTRPEQIQIVSAADVFAKAISHVHNNESTSSIFDF
jgi:ribose-phosphate pyrophosphokinase